MCHGPVVVECLGMVGAQEGQSGRGQTRRVYTLGKREVTAGPGSSCVEGGLRLGGFAAIQDGSGKQQVWCRGPNSRYMSRWLVGSVAGLGCE